MSNLFQVSDAALQEKVVATPDRVTACSPLPGVPRRLLPLTRAIGVTRVADITGLDRLGVHCFQAIRPNARSVSVSMGKSLSSAQARMAAIMEAAENYHAEMSEPSARHVSYRQMQCRAPTIAAEALPSIDGEFDPDIPIDWARGVNLASGGAAWLPFDLVHADYTRSFGAAGFRPNSDGLACSDTPTMARLAAVCEIIERDALARWARQTPEVRARHRLDLATVRDAECCRFLEMVRQAGFSVNAWDITGPTGVATFVCYLTDLALHGFRGPAQGSGCHPNRETALLRAFLEAAQIRLTYIAGARDDIDPAHYERAERGRFESRLVDFATCKILPTSFDAVPTIDSMRSAAMLDWLIDRLSRIGATPVVAVDLGRENLDVAAVRVIIANMRRPQYGRRNG